MIDFIIIEKLLMPPVGNHRYIPIRTKTKGRLSPIKGNGMRLIKAPEFRVYDDKIDLWILRNKVKIDSMRIQVSEWLKSGYCLQLETDFCFPTSKLISLKNELKEIDIDGRKKTVQDTAAKILGISDKWIIRAIDQKPISSQAFTEEYVSLLITPIKKESIQTILQRKDGLLQSSKEIE